MPDKPNLFSQTKFALASVILALILMFIIMFFDLDFGHINDMGPGFLPKILIGMSLGLLVGVVFTTPNVLTEMSARPLVIPGSVIVFALLSTYAGIFWTTALLTPLLVLLWARPRFFQMSLVTGVTLTTVYVMFEILAKF